MNKTKLELVSLFIACFFPIAAFAQSPVTLNIKSYAAIDTIPADYNGLSFEMGSMRYGNAGTYGYFFSQYDQQLINLFNEMGIKNIRMGGGSVDISTINPTDSDIDAFFSFVKATNLKVIYSLRLLNGDPSQDGNIAKYVWNKYGQYIQSYAIGNEPDWNSYHNKDPDITGYQTYITDWNKFATVIRDSVPQAIFGGPDTGSNYPVPGATNTDFTGLSWTVNFAYYQEKIPYVRYIYQHNYVGQSATNKTALQMIDDMLSPTWDKAYYPDLYNTDCAPVVSAGYPYRLTESNSFSGYTPGGSTSFATALFGLDYMYWWAEHGAAGVNFHNKQWVGNGPIYMDASHNYQVYPLGYGIAAFSVGGHGIMDSVTVSNPDTLNLTAYAVRDTSTMYVTIVNKEHSSNARDASVTIGGNGITGNATVMYLKDPNGVTDTVNVTLGGSKITNTGTWQGTWSPVDTSKSGQFVVSVPASSAAIVKIDGIQTSISKTPEIPGKYLLYQNYPNPFNPTTNIKYRLPEAANVELTVYNTLGQKVATLVDRRMSAGVHTVQFDGLNLASGLYIYRLKAGNYVAVKKLLLLK